MYPEHDQDRQPRINGTSHPHQQIRQRQQQEFVRQHERIFVILLVLIAIVFVEVIFVDRVMAKFVNNTPITTATARTDQAGASRILSNNVNTNTATGNRLSDNQRMKSVATILKESDISITEEEEKTTPSTEDVEKLYGEKPIILGLDTCKAFRDSIPRSETLIGPAGLFNTGTNLITKSLTSNCYIPERVEKYGLLSLGMRSQVPWGKHNPVGFRGKHEAEQAGKVDPKYLLPIVAIKDPYTWMSSMCRHKYSCKWNNSGKHCPGLVPITTYEKGFHPQSSALPVRLRYIATNITHYDSLVHLWNTWYNDWLHVKFPRLIIRYEDLLFNIEPVISTICQCAGGVMRDAFKTEAAAAKDMPIHVGSSGLKEALLRYSNATIRSLEYVKEDIDYAETHLDENLMKNFGYHHFRD